MNDAAQPQHFTPRAGSSTSGSPASPASTDFEIQNVRVLASQVVLDSALVKSFNRVLLSAAVQRPDGRGGAQRHRGTRLHETDGRPSGTTTRANPRTGDAAGQPVPAQPHEGSLGALPLPLSPCGDVRRHGATSTSAVWAACATASLPASRPSACPRCP